MSIIKEATGVCRGCGGRSTIEIYKSINVAENPALRDKVRDGSLFLWECPQCGMKNLAKYETLYHDPLRKLMVWLIDGDNVSEAQMQAIANHTKAMGGYTLRIVEDAGSLMEKVLIAEAGLDDCAVELCKYVTKMELASKLGSGDEKRAELFSSTFHFYLIKGEDNACMINFIYPFNGQMQSIDIGMNVYDDCIGILDRNPHARPADGFAKIDAKWVDSFIR